MSSQQRSRSPFETAFLAMVLAIGLPIVVLMFGMVRTRQLQSTANPRWAKFARGAGATSEKPKTQTASQNAKASPLSIQFQEITASDSDHTPLPQASFTGSVAAGRRPIEHITRSEPTSAIPANPVSSRLQPEFEELPPIIFRPVDDEVESQSAQSTRRLESQLTDVRQRLDQLTAQQRELTAQQREQQAEEIARQTKLLEVLTKLNERASIDAATTDLTSVPCTKQPAFDPLNEALPEPQSVPQPEPQFEPLAEPQLEPEPQFAPQLKPVLDPQPEPEPQPQSSTWEEPPITKDVSPATPPYDDVPAAFTPERVRLDDAAIRIRPSTVLNNAETFSIDVSDADIRQVFAKLSEVAQISIIPSPAIQGRVSLNLRDVRIDVALKAIIASRDYVVERDDDIIIVRTLEEASRRKNQSRKLIVKVYRPNYLSAAELIGLIEPLLSSDGRHSATSPALTGLAGAEELSVGDKTAQRDTVIVQDVPEVLNQIDQILVDVDVPPLQVSIEAKILSVRLSDGIQQGIDLSQLPCHRDSGVSLAEGGLKQARLSCSIPTFIKSVERIADTSLVTSQRIQVLNKHRAEMLIGDRIGYQSQAGGDVHFMEAGTRLILRPSISADGFIRLDIHPERSSATTAKRSRQPVQNTAEITTQVMIRDGATVAIGGLIAEQGTETANRLPVVSSIPVIGIPFRNKRERLQRTELIVLVTPKIVIDCESEAEGKCLEHAAEERAAEFRDKQSPKSRHNLARAHYDRACLDYQQGNFVKARQQINASLRENKTDLDAIRLRNQIDQCLVPRVLR